MNKDFFEEIKTREQKRLKQALERAREVVLRDHFSSLSVIPTVLEVKEYEEQLDSFHSLISLALDHFSKHLPSPFEKIKERSVWEVYLSGLKYLARRYPNGFFRKAVLSLKEWNDFPEKIDSYSEKCLSGFSDFSDFTGEVKKYCLNYNKAREIIEQFANFKEQVEEDDDDENGEGIKNLCRLYASLKTWERDQELSYFENRFQKSSTQFFEVIIEGPVQLYLFIGEETWFFVFKILTIERLGDFFSSKDKKELEDIRALHKFIYGIAEKSVLHETFKKLVKETLKIYVDNYFKTQKRLREQYPTEDLRRKFVRRFENGEIFRES